MSPRQCGRYCAIPVGLFLLTQVSFAPGCAVESEKLADDATSLHPLVLDRAPSQALAAYDQEVGTAPSSMAKSTFTITVKGKLFYNDVREYGRWDLRTDMSGHKGSASGSDAEGTQNYLGALDVVADVYEIDSAWCGGDDLVASATVGYDGSFSATFSASDSCAFDTTDVEIGVKFRLRFCDSETRCFSMRNEWGSTYELWWSGASSSNPIVMTKSGTRDLGSAVFQTSSKPADWDDDYSKAANHYASFVDATRAWHIDNDIPFRYDDYGELKGEFPTNETSTTTPNASKIRFADTKTYSSSEATFHEYGHVIHMRAWNGTTGDCGDCPGGDYGRDGDEGNWSNTTLEYPNTAFAEGFANFAVRVSSGKITCAEYDTNRDVSPVEGSDGKSYARNVIKVLCDWYDDKNDDDPRYAGDGDYFEASDLYSVWYNLENMWDSSSSAERNAGLNICDYVDYYIWDRMAASKVGSDHSWYEKTIISLIYQNNVDCGHSLP
ncbi:MAG: hypothetical protein HY675_00105 [Chloroflexi bacterium]|nr:hypothetical protein [Chloroflexota bacterium]